MREIKSDRWSIRQVYSLYAGCFKNTYKNFGVRFQLEKKYEYVRKYLVSEVRNGTCD
jgi:hypothetical protein